MAAQRRSAKKTRKGLAIAAAALGGLVVLVVIAIFVAHTPWGRQQVASQIEERAQEQLRGELEVGSVSGWLLGDLALEDVVLRDERGAVVASAERVSVDYAPWPLLRRHVQLHDVKVESPSVFARVDEEGRLNLLEVYDPPPPDPEVDPFSISIDAFEVTGGAAQAAVVEQPLVALGDIQLRGAVHFEPSDEVIVRPPDEPTRPLEELRVTLEAISASASLREPDRRVVELDGRGSFALVGDELIAESLRVGLGGSFIEVVGLAQDEDGAMRGDVSAELRARDVRQLEPASPLLGDIELSGVIHRDHGGEPIAISLTGSAAGAPLQVHVAADPEVPRADVELASHSFDPGAAVRGAPDGSLDLEIHAAGIGEEAPGPTATLDASAEGSVEGRALEQVEVSAVFDDQVLTADARIATPGARARAEGLLTLGEQPVIEESELRIAVTDVSALTDGEIERGRIQGVLTAAGPIDALDVAGELRGRGLQAGDAKVQAFRIGFEVEEVPGAPIGAIDLDARTIDVGDERLSGARARVALADGGRRATVDLRAGSPEETYGARGQVLVDIGDERVRVHVPELDLRARDLVWHAGGTAVSATRDGEKMVLERLQLRSIAGGIAAEGVIDAGEAGGIALRIDELDLARMRRAFAPAAPPWEGTLHAHARAAWPPERGRLRGDIDGLTMPLLTAIDLSFDVELVDEEAEFFLRTLGEDDELVEVSMRVSAPDPVYDPAAWRELGLDAIEELALAIADVELISRRAISDEVLR